MFEPHPFAKFVAILGRGKIRSRSLDIDEAAEAMAMILRGEALPEQIGAFLMLLRLKEETPTEIAGFVKGARSVMDIPARLPDVDIDWSSYAGKRQQLPWFVLSVLLLARNGYRIFMHGTEGHTPGRVYTRQCLEHLGFPIATSLDEAAVHIKQHNLAYVPLEHLSPKLKEMIELRPILGLRSPVHSFSRMLNPFNAPCMLQGIFHPSFMETHQGAAILLGQKNMAVFRGEGGEIERRPHKPCEVRTVHNGAVDIERWPPMLDEPRQPADEQMDMAMLGALWRGEIDAEYATAAVTGTLAICLKALARADTTDGAQVMAESMWAQRDKGRLPAVA